MRWRNLHNHQGRSPLSGESLRIRQTSRQARHRQDPSSRLRNRGRKSRTRRRKSSHPGLLITSPLASPDSNLNVGHGVPEIRAVSSLAPEPFLDARLAMGDFKLLAWELCEALALNDPEFLKEYESQGIPGAHRGEQRAVRAGWKSSGPRARRELCRVGRAGAGSGEDPSLQSRRRLGRAASHRQRWQIEECNLERTTQAPYRHIRATDLLEHAFPFVHDGLALDCSPVSGCWQR